MFLCHENLLEEIRFKPIYPTSNYWHLGALTERPLNRHPPPGVTSNYCHLADEG
jgi:hypothetical protein